VLADTIARLALDLGGPVFDPHVTLAGPLNGSEPELFERGERLQTLLSPFRIVLDEPHHGSEYFRCVYMRAVPDAAITHANELARRVFDLPERSFMPHLSLLYGNYPADERQRIVDGLPDDLRLTFVADTFDLIVLNSLEPKDWVSVRSWRFVGAPSVLA
jgi:2'-5' RNA ligase